MLNFGGAKPWRIWQIAFLSPNITLQIMRDDSLGAHFRQSLTHQNFYGDLFAKVWYHQSLALYGIFQSYH